MTACRPDKDGDWSKGYTLVWDAWNRADWREARQTERSEARRVRLPWGGSRINRIVQVKNAQTGATVASYAYDGFTRRTTTTIGSNVRRFYYNGDWKTVEERVGSSSNPDRVYYWSARTGHRDELLRRDRATSGGALNETLWCLMDYFDPIAVANDSGAIQERYSYSAFGLVSILTGAFAPRSSTNFAWNFQFHGQFRDPETGWDNYGYRYYLPWLGRWPSRDPIGEEGGLNLFAVTHNQAVNGVDLFGLSTPVFPPRSPGGGNHRPGTGGGKPEGDCFSHACGQGPDKTQSEPSECKEPCPAGKRKVRYYYPQDGGKHQDPDTQPPHHAIGPDPQDPNPGNPTTWSHQMGQGGPIYDGVTDPDKDNAAYYCKLNPEKCRDESGKLKIPKFRVVCACVCPKDENSSPEM